MTFSLAGMILDYPIEFIEAEYPARAIGNTRFDIAFTSCLTRAQETLRQILNETGQNERQYSNLTGITKQEARSLSGEDRVKAWQRSYDAAPPGGESLRDTMARVLPYSITTILPRLLRREKPSSLRMATLCPHNGS